MQPVVKIAVIGGSAGGTLPAIHLGMSSIGPRSALVMIPHIDSGEIYGELKDRGVQVEVVREGTTLRGGTVYVGMRDAILPEMGCDLIPGPDDDPRKCFFGISYTIGYSNDEGCRKFKLGEFGGDYISDAFREAAKEFGNDAIGVILSGAGDDGSRGISAISDAGGLVLVQSSGVGQYTPDMPLAARATGMVSRELSVNNLRLTLEHILR